jgi:hypothetical protein
MPEDIELPPIPENPDDVLEALPEIPPGQLDERDPAERRGGQHQSSDKPPRGIVPRWELPISVNVRGRGVKSPQVQVTSDCDRTKLRIDDTRDDAFWLEMTIPRDTLVELLERSAVQSGTKSFELMQLLDQLRQVWERK